MKKSSFVALVLGTVSGVLFSLGMCMALIPEWNALRPGVIFGGLGLALALVTWLVWRRMTHKAPISSSPKVVLTALLAIAGALTLGVGMCFVMVWDRIVLGTAVGLVGIVALLALIPLTRGITE